MINMVSNLQGSILFPSSHLWVFALLMPLPHFSLTSPFPVTIDADDLQDQQMSLKRCPHQSPINFPTLSSHDDMFWGLGSITRQRSTHTVNLIPVLSIWQLIQ